jgi:hypothetical protein
MRKFSRPTSMAAKVWLDQLQRKRRIAFQKSPIVVAFTRVLIDLAPAGNPHYTLSTAWTAPNDFEFSIDFRKTTLGVMVLAGRQANNTAYVAAFDNSFRFKIGDVTVSQFDFVDADDGKLHTLKYTRISGVLSAFFDGVLMGTSSVSSTFVIDMVGRNGNGFRFHGILSNLKLTDLTTASNSLEFKLDELTANTETNNGVTLTYQNIGTGTSVRNTYVLSNGGTQWISDLQTIDIAGQGVAAPTALYLLGDSFVASGFFASTMSTTFSDRTTTANGVNGSSLVSQAARFSTRTSFFDNILIIMDGGLSDSSADAITAIDSMVANLTSSKWVYVQPSPAELIDGSANRNDWNARVNAIVSHVGASNYVECLTDLQAGNDGSANDLQDVSDDIVPRSLRTDTIHENQAGADIRVAQVQAFIAAKGW